jgi:hypothetical protein
MRMDEPTPKVTSAWAAPAAGNCPMVRGAPTGAIITNPANRDDQWPTLIGPGGGCVFADSAGRLWVAFHGWSGTDKYTFPFSYYDGNHVRQLYFAIAFVRSCSVLPSRTTTPTTVWCSISDSADSNSRLGPASRPLRCVREWWCVRGGLPPTGSSKHQRNCR